MLFTDDDRLINVFLVYDKMPQVSSFYVTLTAHVFVYWLLGNLYFSNVIDSDGIVGSPYVCVTYNSALRTLVQGDDQTVHPVVITGDCRRIFTS